MKQTFHKMQLTPNKTVTNQTGTLNNKTKHKDDFAARVLTCNPGKTQGYRSSEFWDGHRLRGLMESYLAFSGNWLSSGLLSYLGQDSRIKGTKKSRDGTNRLSVWGLVDAFCWFPRTAINCCNVRLSLFYVLTLTISILSLT